MGVNTPPQYSSAEALAPLLSPKLGLDFSAEALALTNPSKSGDESPSATELTAHPKLAQTFSDAMSFLGMLKAKCSADGYSQFVKILADFKDGKHPPYDVSRRVTLLFNRSGQKELAEEMYKWTPWQHRFYMPFTGGTNS